MIRTAQLFVMVSLIICFSTCQAVAANDNNERIINFLPSILAATALNRGDENGNDGPPDQGKFLLSSFYGDYDVTFTGRTGGEYQPTNSIVTGTTTGIVSFSLAGTISLSASEPGVIAVPNGETIPGVAPEDVIFGAAVMQNPVHVFMGTQEASRPGDFGFFSMMRFGLPAGSNLLTYSGGCSPGGGNAFDCVPEFFRRTTPSGDSVNLIYFTIRVSGNQNTLSIYGQLVDTHTTEAAAANLFSVPITSPILGTFNDSFMFNRGALFEIIVSGNNISGRILGTGESVAQLVPQTAIFEATFSGSKKK